MPTYPEAILIEGAGSPEFNGLFLLYPISGFQAYYSVGSFYVYLPENDVTWYMTGEGFSAEAYGAPDTGEGPPLNTWTTLSGEEPAPTITHTLVPETGQQGQRWIRRGGSPMAEAQVYAQEYASSLDPLRPDEAAAIVDQAFYFTYIDEQMS